MAVEVKDVDNNIVIAGGVTTANFPQAARNFRRSAPEAVSLSGWGMELFLLKLEGTSRIHRGSNN
jgi:hypothetical protein